LRSASRRASSRSISAPHPAAEFGFQPHHPPVQLLGDRVGVHRTLPRDAELLAFEAG
jgi:hypothetical protein